MSISVLLYTSKTLKNGEHPIVIRVIKNRKPKYMSIGHSSSLDCWDLAKQMPRRKHPNYRKLEILIEQKRLDAKNLAMELETQNQDFTGQEFEAKLRKKVKQTTVFTFFDDVIDNMIKAGRIGNGKAYKDAKSSLFNFRNGKDLTFRELDLAMLTHYEQYMRERKVVGNTLGAYCRSIRAVYNKAITEGYALKANYPFEDYKVSKLKSDVSKRAISHDAIKALGNLDLSKHTHLIDSRNYFMFSFYCMGINFIDLSQLRWSDVECGRIQYTRSKTSKKFNFKMLEPTIEILKYYKDGTTDDYVFPILHTERHATPVSINNRIKKKLKQMNKDLKELGELANIKTKLTTYVARHSAATVLKRGGSSTPVIQELMGHSTERQTQTYLDNIENEALDLALEGLI